MQKTKKKVEYIGKYVIQNLAINHDKNDGFISNTQLFFSCHDSRVSLESDSVLASAQKKEACHSPELKKNKDKEDPTS